MRHNHDDTRLLLGMAGVAATTLGLLLFQLLGELQSAFRS